MRKKTIYILFFVFLHFAFITSGCAWFETNKEDKTAKQLAQEGMQEFNDGNFKDAIDAFEKLKDWYPFSKYAILAELKVADSYYELEEYDEAIFAYEEFEKLHPRNEATPRIIYKIGQCYYKQIYSIDRDQTLTTKALDVFIRLISMFPNNKYSQKSEKYIKSCIKNLAGHDFSVGEFYYDSGHYKAALFRFMSVILSYPDVGYHIKALNYIPKCEKIIETKQEQKEKNKKEQKNGKDV